MRIAITGSSGFIGTNLVQHCLDLHHDILAMDKEMPRIHGHLPVFRRVDILDRKRLSTELTGFHPDVIVHLAARTDLEEHPGTVGYEANTDGVHSVIDASRSCSRLRLIAFASSRLVFAIDHQPANDWDYKPSTTYGRSKVAGELLVRDQANGPPCPWVIVRPTSIWGPWFGVPYRNFFDLIQKGCYIHPNGRAIRKSFGFVGNTVHQISRLMELEPARVHGKVLFLADYEPVELGDWSRRICTAMGRKPVRHVPYPMLKALALVGDAAKWIGIRNPPLSSFRLSNLMTEMVYDVSQTKSLVGDVPYSLDEGIAQTIRWMRDDARRHG